MSWFGWDDENAYETNLGIKENKLKARLGHLKEIFDSFLSDGYGLDELDLRLGGEEGGVKLDYELTGDQIFMRLRILLHHIIKNDNTLKANHPNWKTECTSECLLEWVKVNRKDLQELASLMGQVLTA